MSKSRVGFGYVNFRLLKDLECTSTSLLLNKISLQNFALCMNISCINWTPLQKQTETMLQNLLFCLIHKHIYWHNGQSIITVRKEILPTILSWVFHSLKSISPYWTALTSTLHCAAINVEYVFFKKHQLKCHLSTAHNLITFSILFPHFPHH